MGINTWQIVDYHLLVIALTVILFLFIGVWVVYLRHKEERI